MNTETVNSKTPFADFRAVLLETLNERCHKNPRYSLRSFARSLDISHGALSEILGGRRPLSGKMVSRLGSAIGLSSLAIRGYLKPGGSALDSEQSGPKTPKSALAKTYYQVDHDQFEVIADWHHFAILEGLKIGRIQTPAQMARFLGISLSEVHLALERMERLKFIRRSSNGKILKLAGNDLSSETGSLTTVARRRHQRQLLEASLTALEQVELKNRVHTATIMAIDPKKIGEVRDLITKFKRDLEDYLIESNKLTAIYAVQVALFPVSKLEDVK